MASRQATPAVTGTAVSAEPQTPICSALINTACIYITVDGLALANECSTPVK